MANSKAWSSCKLMNDETPMTPSAPGRFSTMTGCAQRTDRRSANSLAVKSAALPAGTGRISRTVRSGQALPELQTDSHRKTVTTKPANARYILLPVLCCYDFSFTSSCARTDIFLVCGYDLEHQFDEAFAVVRRQTGKQLALAGQSARKQPLAGLKPCARTAQFPYPTVSFVREPFDQTFQFKLVYKPPRVDAVNADDIRQAALIDVGVIFNNGQNGP